MLKYFLHSLYYFFLLIDQVVHMIFLCNILYCYFFYFLLFVLIILKESFLLYILHFYLRHAHHIVKINFCENHLNIQDLNMLNLPLLNCNLCFDIHLLNMLFLDRNCLLLKIFLFFLYLFCELDFLTLKNIIDNFFFYYILFYKNKKNFYNYN